MPKKNSIIGKIANVTGINRHFGKFEKVGIPLDKDYKDYIVSPVQGRVVTIGAIDKQGNILSKNNKKVILSSLIGRHCKSFVGGYYLNIYLTPVDKHFWIAPYYGKFIYTQKNEGVAKIPTIVALEKVFSHIPTLRRMDILEKAIRKNATISSVFETEQFPLAMIAVGSLNVNRIHIVYRENEYCSIGAPCGYFSIGSSMILCIPSCLEIMVGVGDKIRIGQKILRILKHIQKER